MELYSFKYCSDHQRAPFLPSMGTTTSFPPWPAQKAEGRSAKGSGTFYTRGQRDGLVGGDYEALKQAEALKGIRGNPKWHKNGRKKRSINDQEEEINQ